MWDGINNAKICRKIVTLLLCLILIIIGTEAYKIGNELEQEAAELRLEQEEKLQYAIDNEFTFYLDGEDVTSKIDFMDMSQYTLSYEKYDEEIIMMSTTKTEYHTKTRFIPLFFGR